MVRVDPARWPSPFCYFRAMNRGLISLIIGVLVIIVLILVIMRLA